MQHLRDELLEHLDVLRHDCGVIRADPGSKAQHTVVLLWERYGMGASAGDIKEPHLIGGLLSIIQRMVSVNIDNDIAHLGV